VGRTALLAAAGTLIVLLSPATSSSRSIDFTTPSRNIGCAGDATSVRCDIRATRTKPPPKPRSCRFDWGNAFALRQRGRPRRLCHSDTVLGSSRVLRYGRTQRFGRGIRCTSRTSGLTCRNRDGHGFFLSRERVRLF
jgi:hypothetical protein